MALPAVLMVVGFATGFGDMDDLLEYSDVFAIALLVNGAVSLGLWLFGCWPDVAREGGCPETGRDGGEKLYLGNPLERSTVCHSRDGVWSHPLIGRQTDAGRPPSDYSCWVVSNDVRRRCHFP